MEHIMGTRSFIAMKMQDGFKGVYCHWDGYLEHVGRILRQHYTDPAKIAELIEHGDISSLDFNIGRSHDFDDSPQGQTTFYGRDRGDNDCGPTSRTTLPAVMEYANGCGCEYFYLFADGDWTYAERGPQYFGQSDGSPFSELRPLPQEIRPPVINPNIAVTTCQLASGQLLPHQPQVHNAPHMFLITVAVPDDEFVILRIDVPAEKFPLGQLVMTRNAADRLDAVAVHESLSRHASGDWGDIGNEDAQLNADALQNGDRLMSVYGTGERKFWIITEADRSVTTVLMPEDY
jgi:hypothetical protein